MFFGKGVLEICSKFTGEHPCPSVISVKLQSSFVEITLRQGCSPVYLLNIFRTPLITPGEVYFWFPRFGRQYLFLNATPRVYCVEIWFRERCINNDLMSLLWFLYAFSTLEKQTFANVFQHRCSWKFLNVQRETPLLESLVNKVAGLQHRWWLLLTII